MDRLGIDRDAFTNTQRYLLIRELLGAIITDVITATDARLNDEGITDLAGVRSHHSKLLGPSETMAAGLTELKAFLYENFYFHHRLIRMSRKAHQILERIYNAYIETPTMLPPAVRAQAEDLGLERALTDYLSGMTDRYANDEYRKLFDPTALT